MHSKCHKLFERLLRIESTTPCHSGTVWHDPKRYEIRFKTNRQNIKAEDELLNFGRDMDTSF